MDFVHLIFILCLLLTSATIEMITAKSNIEMVFDACTCNSTDPDGYLSSLVCTVSKNVKRRTFTVEIEFAKTIDKFNLNLCIELPRKPSNFVLFNVTNLDGCQLLGNRNQFTFVQVGVSELKRFSNLPTHCPFLKDKTYYIRGYRMDMSMFPAFTFETYMNIWFDFVIDGNKIIQGFIQGHSYIKRSKPLFTAA